MSRQRRNVILAQVAECRSTFCTTSSSAEESSSTGLDSGSAVSESSSGGGAEPDVLDRTYGQKQEDHHQVADHSHEHFLQKDDDGEGLESTGFDMSKVSKPSGDE
ncbi:hypothetical protein MPTK1_7g16770 [Marchantia polymorpha subsp. ruderalis]|nr:hypothetical protein MARPO_0051s0015 [Marchantia polymorpha]BBN17753.1 hypothetical protein Mp_7g16770 [Marchantia polymorpha subsp. ruderalis]|eukprot:PTQ38379.1 hypothetical protein MARPO_0051s0015 [Marchantia polymorpha]